MITLGPPPGPSTFLLGTSVLAVKEVLCDANPPVVKELFEHLPSLTACPPRKRDNFKFLV
jgi:hypothetical protein